MQSAQLTATLTKVLKSAPNGVEFHRMEVRESYPFESDLPVTVELHLSDAQKVKQTATALALPNDRRVSNAYSGDFEAAKAHVLVYGPKTAKSASDPEAVSVPDAPAEEVAAEE